jgi:hypothetical protein
MENEAGIYTPAEMHPLLVELVTGGTQRDVQSLRKVNFGEIISNQT